jgi:hypothetical protein
MSPNISSSTKDLLQKLLNADINRRLDFNTMLNLPIFTGGEVKDLNTVAA